MSIVAQITQNLISVFDGATITVADQDLIITAETERVKRVINGRYPYLEIQGPIVNVVSRAHRVVNCDLFYSMELLLDINDAYEDNHDYLTITETTQNVAADLIRLLMADQQRGFVQGYPTKRLAHKTDYEGFGYRFTGNPEHPDFSIYLDFSVNTTINENDPYLIGG
jgi:hypothetical protein